MGQGSTASGATASAFGQGNRDRSGQHRQCHRRDGDWPGLDRERRARVRRRHSRHR
jgi:hypothetical protein